METKENKAKENKTQEQKVKFSDKHPLFICTMIIIGFVVIVLGGVWVIEYNSCPYHLSYNRPGVKNRIDVCTAKANQCFGDVYIPTMSLSDERIFIKRYEDIPGPSPTQYGIWYNASEKQGELKTKLLALVQLPPKLSNLTKEEIIEMSENGELLCGGAVKEIECHSYSWKDLPNKAQNEIRHLSDIQDFGSAVEKKHQKGILSVTKIYDIPSDCPEQSLISYFVESPYGVKNEKILVQGDYKTNTPLIYGGINQ